jgi:hypothetical protein
MYYDLATNSLHNALHGELLYVISNLFSIVLRADESQLGRRSVDNMQGQVALAASAVLPGTLVDHM